MRIFIDETGSFSGFGVPSSLSLVGALIIPSSRLGSLEREYLRVRKSLPLASGEVKGRLLSEEQVVLIIQTLYNHSALFECVGIDLGIHTEMGLQRWQARQAELMTSTLTDDHDANVREVIFGFRREFENFKLPLMIQSFLTFDLNMNIIETATMYFSQRRPEELREFDWVIDAKGNSNAATGWEKWWSQFILPVLQSRTLSEPAFVLPIGNYSFMRRFEMPTTPFLRRHTQVRNIDAPTMNLALILGEYFKFNKESEPGIELVDSVTNATRRALVGNLGRDGYRHIPSLMIHRSQPSYIKLISLLDAPAESPECQYKSVLREFGKGGRNMSTRRTTNSKWYRSKSRP